MVLESDATARIAVDARSIAIRMASVVDELMLRGAWCGRDAETFRSRWEADVTEALRAAANVLDGISFDEVARAVAVSSRV